MNGSDLRPSYTLARAGAGSSSNIELRGLPHDTRDLWIAAANNSLVAYDNVSTLPRWLSDAFFELAPGGGQSNRTPFSESDETIFTGIRPVMMTGIEDFATYSDFLWRSVILTLPYIPEHKRMPEMSLPLSNHRRA